MLKNTVALVTGASRGIGKGIALQLGEAGATVYVTGRPPAQSDSTKTGLNLPTLEKTAQEITERGGQGIAAYCDHSQPEEVKNLFERIESEQKGQLDLLVNNAYSAVNLLSDNNFARKKFYQHDPSVWDEVNNVGLKNHYVCSVYAARLMVPKRKGLIVNISSFAGLGYAINVAYGVGKAACDRMAGDMAAELKSKNVAAVSLWPGAVKTEMIKEKNLDKEDQHQTALNAMFRHGESIEYAGKAVVQLASDPDIMAKSGRTLMAFDLGDEYGFTDIDGTKPLNYRSLHGALTLRNRTWLAAVTPGFIKVPHWVMAANASKL